MVKRMEKIKAQRRVKWRLHRRKMENHEKEGRISKE
jgi:hypothetical protein